MSGQILAAIAAIGTVLGLLAGLVRQWLKNRDMEGKLARSAEILADVQRRNAGLAHAHLAREAKERDRALRTGHVIQEIDARTFEDLRREPATALEMETEARRAVEEARTLADAFGDGSLGPSHPGDEDPKP